MNAYNRNVKKEIRKSRKRALCVFCILSFLLSGCGSAGRLEEEAGDGMPHEAAADGAGSMGRYMEEFFPVPEEINRNGGLNFLDDGSMTIISINNGCYRTEDMGKSWQHEETAWFPLLQVVYCVDAKMGPDRTGAATCVGQMPAAAREMYGKPLPEDWEGNYCVFALPDGEIKVVDFGLSPAGENRIESFCFKEDGRLFAGDLSGRVYEVDIEKEKLTELFSAERKVGYMDFSD